MIEGIYSILVNWNLKEDTLECIDSLMEAGVLPERIVVVDNDSNDGSVEAIRTRYGGAIHCIESHRNLGYAGGLNLGIDHALDSGADWLFILNNDTKVSPEILQAFRNVNDRFSQFSVLSPVIYYYDRPEIVWFYGVQLIGRTLATKQLYNNKRLPADTPEFQEVDLVNGCGLIVKRDVFEAVGRFNSDLFMYGEEIDFIWRARMAGFRTAVCRDARMYHKVSRSAQQDLPAKRFYQVRNQILFYRKYSTGLQLATMFFFSGLKLISTGIRDLLVGNAGLIPWLARGWYAGWSLPLGEDR